MKPVKFEAGSLLKVSPKCGSVPEGLRREGHNELPDPYLVGNVSLATNDPFLVPFHTWCPSESTSPECVDQHTDLEVNDDFLEGVCENQWKRQLSTASTAIPDDTWSR